jgi:hypothetical protein
MFIGVFGGGESIGGVEILSGVTKNFCGVPRGSKKLNFFKFFYKFRLMVLKLLRKAWGVGK